MINSRCFLLLLSSVLLPGVVLAQPAGARGDNFIYRVLAGDTLSNIATTYTGKVQNWVTLQTLNQVADTLALPIGKELAIPFSLIPSHASTLAIIHRSGQVQVNGQTLATEALTLNEGDRIQTGEQSSLSVKLHDNSVLLIPANSSLTVQRARVFEGAPLSDTIVTLEDGDLESVVAPESPGVGRFEVRTPVSITGVRGTSLRVRHKAQVSVSEVLEGRAELRTSTNTQYDQIPASYGASASADKPGVTISQLPQAPHITEPVRQGAQWTVQASAQPEVSSYLVQVARDAQGTELLSRHTQSGPALTFSAKRPGNHYVLIRSISEQGLMSADTVAQFEGASTLRTGDGGFITTAFGDPVLVRDF